MPPCWNIVKKKSEGGFPYELKLHHRVAFPFISFLFPYGLIIAVILLLVIRRKHISKKSALFSGITLVLFWLFIGTVYYFRYASLPEVMPFYIIIGVIGAVPVLVKFYLLGATFLAGAAAGWLLDCIISAKMAHTPTMAAGMANIFALILGLLLAVILEIVYRKVRT